MKPAFGHFYPLSFPAEGVLSLPVSVYLLSVRPSVCKLFHVRIMHPRVIELDLQGHFGHFGSEFREIWLVHMITYNGFQPVGHMVLKIDVPCKNFHVPSQYMYKLCRAYVYCWENNYMPWLKNHLPSRAHNYKSLCALGQDLHALGMQAHLNVEPCLGILLDGIKNGGHWPWSSTLFGHFDLEFQVKLSTSLLHTDLGWPKGVTRPKVLL